MKISFDDQIRQWKQFIMTSFHESGKKHLLITGSRQIGKTTVLNEILKDMDPADIGGIMTYAVRDDLQMPKEVVLKDRNLSKVWGIIAKRNDQGTSLVPCVETFEDLGSRILKKYNHTGVSYVVIDEIGYLEVNAFKYCEEIKNCFEQKRVMAVIRKELNSFTEGLIQRQDIFLIDLDEAP